MLLYHGSQNSNLTELKPRPTRSNNKLIGNYLFATKNYKLAIMYLTPKGLAILMEPDTDPNIVICSSAEQFKNKDKGGTVYELPSTTFVDTPQTDLSNYEMVSKEPVMPVNKTVFVDTLQAMIEAGIKVRFVNDATFKKLIRHPKQKELISAIPIYK